MVEWGRLEPGQRSGPLTSAAVASSLEVLQRESRLEHLKAGGKDKRSKEGRAGAIDGKEGGRGRGSAGRVIGGCSGVGGWKEVRG